MTDRRFRSFGFSSFFLSGLCAISAGIIVSQLQDRFGFSFGTTGTLLSCMSIGNVIASFLSGMLPSRIGMKKTVLILAAGYAAGYALMNLSSIVLLTAAAFLMVGLAKGSVLNTCTVMVGTHSEDRSKGLQLMHACYACGALLCPFVISLCTRISSSFAVFSIAAAGLLLWLVFFFSPLDDRKPGQKKKSADRAFLKHADFWLLTALLFCQNAAETSVTGWLVSYYKGQQILSGTLAAYTMTIMWGATLIGRLLIAFVIPIRNRFRALTIMGIGCSALYLLLVMMTEPVPAVLALFAFSFAMAGVNPMAVSCAGSALSSEGVGIMLPIAAVGGILMPSVIGIFADAFGLQFGMGINLVPCIGIILISAVLYFRESAASRMRSTRSM